MLADSLIVPECVFRPGSFTGLMTIYESNFVKFDQLCGDSFPVDGLRVSTAQDDCDLHLHVLKREPYTTTFTLTYWFDDEAHPDRQTPDPDLLVRMYHDAMLVEAVSGREEHQHHMLQALARSHLRELDRRWRINMMLNKWLDYLLDKGHSFA